MTNKARKSFVFVANHIKWFIAAFLLTIIVGAIGYAVFEDYTWYQNIEWSIQTITSTGYGNLPAQTVGGSIWSSIMMLWGPPVTLSVLTGLIVNAVREDPNVFTDEEQKQIINDLTEIKAMLKERGE